MGEGPENVAHANTTLTNCGSYSSDSPSQA